MAPGSANNCQICIFRMNSTTESIGKLKLLKFPNLFIENNYFPPLYNKFFIRSPADSKSVGGNPANKWTPVNSKRHYIGVQHYCRNTSRTRDNYVVNGWMCHLL